MLPSFTRDSATAQGRRISFDLEVTTQDAPFAGLPEALSGVTLAQLSDLHFGCGNTTALIEAAIGQANALEPDYILVTGDFVDHHLHNILPVVERVSALRARRGVYAVLGNHDHRADPALLANALKTVGITVLQNAAVELADGFWLAGVDDLYEGDPDLDVALGDVPEDAAAILLSHHPGALDRVPPDRPLLILSGHTHGAQIALPFPTPKMVCWWHLRTPYVQGWYRRGAARLYVNRGIGVTGWGPTARRYRCPAEITLFRLTAAGEVGDRERMADRRLRIECGGL